MIYVCYYDTSCDDAEVILATQNREKAIDNVLTSKANTLQLWNNDKMIDEYSLWKPSIYEGDNPTTRKDLEKWLSNYITFSKDDSSNQKDFKNFNKLYKIAMFVKEKDGLNFRHKDIIQDISKSCFHDELIMNTLKMNKNKITIQGKYNTYEVINFDKKTIGKGKRFDFVCLCSVFGDKFTNEEINQIFKPIAKQQIILFEI